ncbi:ABC transporter permease [Nocardioides nitrophenolicus]|uniref:ABC transporter permease n=1 Tax=Nocardioides nitrophenolicus TaxID=60489 RepID=UPI00195C1420|nr:FtsX-like permease family protein [Nocardioides nitrophenolicus]MBM7518960.1 putative ABC transport system permease protein [Nocardioides nitrophenolicus]
MSTPSAGSARSRWRALDRLTRDAGASLLLRPGHTVGMVAGIMLGVASALAAVVIAETQQAQVDLRFDLQRSNHAVVKAMWSTPDGFDPRQVRQIGALEPVEAAGEFSVWIEAARVAGSAGLHATSAPVLVADPGGVEATGTRVVEGASADLLGLAGPDPARFAWVGVGLARELGVGPASDGRTDAQIVVGGQPLSVAGVVDNRGQFGYADRAVVVSRPVATTVLGGEGSNARLVAHVRPGSAAAVVDYMLRAADPSGQLPLVDATPPDGERLVADVGADLRLIGAAMGAFIGLVGMVAVANTLMMSVHQRQRELGLRSAIGWSRRRIGLLVLTESAVAGLIAGLVGSGLGLAAAAAWCWLSGWTLVVPPLLPFGVVLGGLAASLVGGLIPALRASSISPLTAMRS